jgi:hypothetical protein
MEVASVTSNLAVVLAAEVLTSGST